MDALAKVTTAIALLPAVSSGLTLTTTAPLIAQITSHTPTTQAISSEPNITTISGGTQAGNNLFHSFANFHLEQQQTANFITLPNTHSVIGQVLSGTASNIDGLLQVTGSNADLYLINPAGLLFGPNARLDLGGSFIATTATHLGNDQQWFDVLSNPDYSTLITPPSQFGFSRPSSVINHGQLTVRTGQSLRLIAPQVINTGTLTAPDGEVTLIATELGQTIQFQPTDSLLKLEIIPDKIITDALPTMLTGGDFHHSDKVIIDNDGQVKLIAHEINQESPVAVQDIINLNNSGNISTIGVTGGEINLVGSTINVTNSTLDASGTVQGGSIRIGGDYQGQPNLPSASTTIITETASLRANGLQGDAGQVIVWSDGSTAFHGNISAQATISGNGGLVETSGLQQLHIGDTATVNTTSQGEHGLWLLDPDNLIIADNTFDGDFTTFTDVNMALNSPEDTSILSVATVNNALGSTNISLQANESITIASPINALSNTNNLFLDTATLNLNAPITLNDDGELSGTAAVVNVGANGSVQNGVDTVADGGTVNLAAATYREGHTITLDRPLTIAGQEQKATVISGDADNSGTGDHPVFNIPEEGNNIQILSLTIQNGWSTSDGAGLSNYGNNILIRDVAFTNNQITGSAKDGAAIHNQGSLTLSDALFENNRTSSDGGAIDILQGSVVITDSVFSNNQSGGHGGAIDVDPNGHLTISNSSFSFNTAGTNGGGIYSDGGLTIDKSNFTGNSANELGGALWVDNEAEIENSALFKNIAQGGGGLTNQGELTLSNSVITNNQATGIGNNHGGGGLQNISGGDLIIESSLISNNTSAITGGGILNLANDTRTAVAISNSSIVGNQAGTLGGGIEVASSDALGNLSQITINNSTISGNQATTGGGIRTVGSTTLINATIANNRAITSGGGLSENQTASTAPSLINTIIANNSAPLNPDLEGDFLDQGHNLIGIAQGSSGLTNSTLVGTNSEPLNPRLSHLRSGSGSLPSHQLLSDSPAANTGNNQVATAVDQNGQTRIVGGIIDIGAVESDILTTVSGTPPPSSPATPTSSENPGAPSALPQQLQLSTSPTNSLTIHESAILTQEDKTVQKLNLNPDETHYTTPNRRIRYLDEAAFQYLEATFSKDFEQYWQLPQTQPVTLETIQKTLQEVSNTHQTQSAVIYAVYVPSTPSTETSLDSFVLPYTDDLPTPDDQLLLILVPPTGTPIQHLVNVSRAQLNQQAQLFRLAVSDPEDSVSYRALARQMYTWLLAPLQLELEKHNIDHMMYSLDQGLRTIPIAAMMQEDSFVIEQYGISVIPSIGLTQYSLENTSPNQRALVAGANEFESFEDIPAVTTELELVSKNTHANDVLLNEAFTLDNFLKLKASQRYDLLHLATHAEFNTGNLDQSFIQFWDSRLTFREMQKLNWPALELLILSACGTALSSPDAELGFTGLAAAAGIETAIGSLWNVSDVGTLALMAEFYAQLPQPLLRFNWLQKAQIALIQSDTHINNNILYTSQGEIDLPPAWSLPISVDFSHPFYWAGFTMVGNPWH